MDSVLEFIGDIPGGIWDLLPAFGAPGWIGEVIKGLVGLSGLTVLSRIVPDKWLYVPITQFFDKIALAISVPLFVFGKSVSAAGRKILGKKRWEKVEEQVVQKAIGLFFVAVFDGLSLFIQRIRNPVLDGLDADDPAP